MKLNDIKLRSLKKTPVLGKHTDGDGLYLKITATGGMYWQWKIRTPRETIISYGTYPQVSLAEARKFHREAKAQRREGIDPNTHKRKTAETKRLVAGNTFGSVTKEWLVVMESKWSEGHLETNKQRIAKNLTPYLDSRPISEIEAPELLKVLRKIEDRGATETAHRVRFIASQVFRFAIATRRASQNPAADLVDTLKTPIEGHHSAILEPEKLGQLMRDIRAYRGSPIVRAALLIHALTFQRPNEIRGTGWWVGRLDVLP